MMDSEPTANGAICFSESKPASAMEMIIQWFDEGIAGAQPLESPKEMDWEAMEQHIKKADTDVANDDRYSNIEESKYSRYVYHVDESLACLATQKEEAPTKQSVFIDSILHDAHIYILFAVVHVVCCVNHTPLFQLFLFILFMILLFLYWYINYVPFLFLEEDIKWIRRESRLLSAVLKDAAEVKRLCTQIDTRAHQIWDSNLEEAVAGLDKNAQAEWVRKSVAVAGLDHNESKWVDETISIVPEAQSLVESFEEMRRDSHRTRVCLGITKKNFMQIGELFIKSRLVMEEVSYIVMKKEHGINICESLERLRSNARRLQERPLDEHEERSVNSGGRVASAADLASSTVEKIDSLIDQNPDLLQENSSTGEQIKSTSLLLQLLHPFLKDIQGLDQFESAIEQAWVEEVVELIYEAHLAIENFLKKPSYRIRWLSFISSWKARRKIKWDIRCINFGFTQVLERKERYGFKFTRTNCSKVIYQSPDQTTGDSFISPVVGRMHNYLKEKSDVLGELFSEVALLFNQLEIIRKLVGDAGMFRRGYNSRIAWLDQTEKIVRSVDEYVTLCTSRKFETKAGIKLSREINQINHTISLFLRCIKAFSIELREDSSLVVGLEKKIDEVVSRLRTNNEHCSVTSIFGIVGIGKTTLAKKVYNHGVVVDHFPCRAWVSLPHDYSYNNEQLLLEDVAKQVLKSFKSEKHPEINPNASSLIHKAHDILKEKRYLLVLDNISTKKEWDDLKAAFPVSTSHGSRILVTTRYSNVASEAGGDIQLEPLTKEESWQLFSQVVHIPPKGKMLTKEILSKCEGIPLAIIRLLSGKDEATAQELKRVIQHCKQNDTSSLNDYTKKCITMLPRDLSNCLSCFKLFPRDYKIPVRRLFALWIAEGLAEVREHTAGTHKSDSKNTQQALPSLTHNSADERPKSADEHLSALIDRDIVQVVERKLNGKVRTCCLNKDLEEVVRSETMTLDQIQLADHVNCRDQSFKYIHGESSNFPDSYTGLFSILSFDHQEGYKPGEDIGNFLRRGIAAGFFLQLKFLDLECVFRPDLPSTIGKLSMLRYLGLRWTCLESIPPSIGELFNLETLDVKHTYVHTLPSSIWKLHKLRHLYLSQRYRSKLSCHQGRSSLKNLRTLWGVFVDQHSPLKDGLDKISNLRKLGLAFHLENKEEQKLLAERIGELNHLQSLRIRSIDEMGEPRPLVLESLSGLEKLSSLNLFGVLGDPSIIEKFRKNLTDLTLSASYFADDPMPKLEKLSNLQSLCFYSNSYTGKKMVCTTWKFEKLLILKLWKLEHLEDWVVQEKAMQNLKELEIRSCVKLKVPTGVRHLKRLVELKLTNMPEAFCAAMDKTNVELWGDIAQSLEIIKDSW